MPALMEMGDAKLAKVLFLESKEWEFLKTCVILLEKVISYDVFSHFFKVFSLCPLRLCGELLRKITINQRPLCAEDLSQSKSENYASDADL